MRLAARRPFKGERITATTTNAVELARSTSVNSTKTSKFNILIQFLSSFNIFTTHFIRKRGGVMAYAIHQSLISIFVDCFP